MTGNVIVLQDKLVPALDKNADAHLIKQHELKRNDAGLALLSVFATLDPKTD